MPYRRSCSKTDCAGCSRRQVPGVLVGLALLGLAACTYDPPPEVSFVQPEAGVFHVGDPIELSFSEPIDPATFRISIYEAAERNSEGEFPPSAVPRMKPCTSSSSPCGTNTLELDSTVTGATIVLDPLDLGQPDVPLVLEISAGLADLERNATGEARTFDFQFRPPDAELDTSTDYVEFEQGVYVLVATVDEPLPVVFTLITDMVEGPDGRVGMAGAEGDEIGEAPRDTTNPAELEVDTSEEGYVVFAYGYIRESEGQRFLVSDSFDVTMPAGPIVVTLEGVHLSGLIEPEPEGAHDGIEGTLSYERVVIDTGSGEPFEYEGTTVAFVGVFATPDVAPAGHPEVCGDVCGTVPGNCNPPEGFPEEGICVENNE